MLQESNEKKRIIEYKWVRADDDREDWGDEDRLLLSYTTTNRPERGYNDDCVVKLRS